MISWRSLQFPSAIIVLGFFFLLVPQGLSARTIIVPTDVSSIQSAIDQAVSGDIVRVMPKAEPYEETLILKEGVTLEGAETARTIIDGGGAGIVITAGEDTRIRNMTITGGITGISANNISGLTISNNLIVGNTTGIDCLNASVVINQNTIDNNDTNGISCVPFQSVSITNNLITNNGTGINLSNTASVTVNQNGFYANDGNGEEGTSAVKAGDPLFVNVLENDYHLKIGSPGLYRGSDLADPEDDLGAYGGSEADSIPFPVVGMTLSPETDSVTVRWRPNQAYNIAGYRIYSNKNKDIHENPESADTTICDGNECVFTLTGLDNTVAQPGAPELQAAVTGDQKLFLNWIPPSNQDDIVSYKVFWGTVSDNYNDPDSPQNVGNITAYTLLNLTNNMPYFIALKAVAQARLFISVTAIDTASPANESRFEAQEVVLTAAPALESVFSNEVNEFPEEVLAFPNLPDEGGCFIATVAYGSPFATHVQILRAFRDRYLLPTELGRRFVSFYYDNGPSWANFIQENEVLKFLVRLLLLPIVVLSYFLIETTVIQKIGSLLVLSMFIFFVLRLRVRHSRSAGL